MTFVGPGRLNIGGIEVEVASRSMTGSGIGESGRSMYEKVSERDGSGFRARSEKLCLSYG